MNVQDIGLIYEYNYWANHKILKASEGVSQEQFLAPADFPFGGLRGTIVHIMDAEWGWRGLFESNSFGEDLNMNDFPTIKSIQKRWTEEEKAMRAYISRLKDEDMNMHLYYKSGSGAQRDRILWHCLLHVVNHGTQHRAEAAVMLTSFGYSPGDLDLSVFLLEQKP